VRLVGESRLARDLGERARPVDRVPREREPPHQEVAIRARAEHDPELAREVVARQARD
jgi:hypothetical protein